MSLRCLSVVCLTALLVLPLCQSRSLSYVQKRITDQRVGEMETLMETLMDRVKGVMHVPFGDNNISPVHIGRRKRTSQLLRELLSQEQRSREDQEDEDNPSWLSELA